MEVTGKLRLIVAVSINAGTKKDGEGERFASGAINVGNVVVTEIMRSTVMLGSLCYHILS